MQSNSNSAPSGYSGMPKPSDPYSVCYDVNHSWIPYEYRWNWDSTTTTPQLMPSLEIKYDETEREGNCGCEPRPITDMCQSLFEVYGTGSRDSNVPSYQKGVDLRNQLRKNVWRARDRLWLSHSKFGGLDRGWSSVFDAYNMKQASSTLPGGPWTPYVTPGQQEADSNLRKVRPEPLGSAIVDVDGEKEPTKMLDLMVDFIVSRCPSGGDEYADSRQKFVFPPPSYCDYYGPNIRPDNFSTPAPGCQPSEGQQIPRKTAELWIQMLQDKVSKYSGTGYIRSWNDDQTSDFMGLFRAAFDGGELFGVFHHVEEECGWDHQVLASVSMRSAVMMPVSS